MISITLVKKSFLRAVKLGRKVAMVENCRCPLCAERVNKEEFRNEIFIKEFENSGLCQSCLETVFGYKVAW